MKIFLFNSLLITIIYKKLINKKINFTSQNESIFQLI